MNFLTAWFNRLNTHTVFGIGLGSALVGVASLASQHGIDATIRAHVPGATGILTQALIDQQIQTLAAPVAALGAVLAGVGRPPNVPAGPVLTPEVHVGVGPQVK